MRILLFILVAFSSFHVMSQGCVAIRSNGGVCTMSSDHHNNKATDQKWSLAINSRYFRSYKHFVGKVEQHERTEAGTEVINYSFATELSLTRRLNERWSLSLYSPIISNVRSSLYEHYGNTNKSPRARRTTRSFGLGDVRIAAYYWLTNPAKDSKFHLQVGAGIKLPTGDYRYHDYFFRNDSTKMLGPVDQSIQLGDGGTGLATEYNAFYKIGDKLSIYNNAYYLFNPREQNGVSTARGGTPTATSIQYGSDVMSVPDQYMMRLGANFSAHSFSASAGMRIEGLPAKDAIGSSNGFRRPGYVLSIEPVIAYKINKAHFYISVPYAVERNRIQSVPDKIRTQLTGIYAQGDAAFANYSINVGFTTSL